MATEKNNDLGGKFTRRKFLKATGAGLAWITLTNASGCEPPGRTQEATGSPAQPEQVWSFRSRPDLSPPTIEVLTQARNTAPGYVLVAPKKGAGQNGPMIVDNSGQPVWFRPLQDQDEYAMDFKVQRYRGEPVLTWCEGRVVAGHGLDEYVIADSSYREIKRFEAGNGYRGDHHEFLITPQDTALITIYNPVRRDLSALGGSKNAAVLEGIAQEIDIESGEVIFEWHSLDHVGLDESYVEPPKKPEWPFDYFHINSIDVDYDSNLLISARKTFSVYKVDRKSGEVIWRLGGKKSSFEMGAGTRTRYQHDARRHSDGTITIFDNGDMKVDEQSRGIVLELDEKAMSASLLRKYTHPDKRFAETQGDVQVLANGNVFIGWGSAPFFSEFSPEGRLLFDARFSDTNESYRAFRFPWSGQPGDDPVVVAKPKDGGDEKLTLYASWNGATEVASWQVLAGPKPGRLKPIGSAPRDGFETTIVVRTTTEESYVSVQARDRSGRVLATSKAIMPGN